MRRRFWLLYPVWILFCAALFLAFRHIPDPSRSGGRILSDDAAALAVAALRGVDRARYAGYEPVHVAWAGAGEVGPGGRWIVLCDRVPHSGLADAVVVEIDGRSGALLRIRPVWRRAPPPAAPKVDSIHP